MMQDPAMYSYEKELLARIMTKLHENNPELSDRKRHTMKPPQLMRGPFSLIMFPPFPFPSLFMQSVRKKRFGSISKRFARWCIGIQIMCFSLRSQNWGPKVPSMGIKDLWFAVGMSQSTLRASSENISPNTSRAKCVDHQTQHSPEIV